MNRIAHLFVWLSRIRHCRGFGIQSPTDYAFVRYVVNEHWPYYFYEQPIEGERWLQRKLGRLYFRLANWRQPSAVIDLVGAYRYVQAGCHKAKLVEGVSTNSAPTGPASPIELALLPIDADIQHYIERCDSHSVIVVEHISKDPHRWKALLSNPHVTIAYDLYYCGILLFDPQRTPQRYIINF